MKLFNGLTAGVSLAAMMALSTPAQAKALLASESLDSGYGQSQPTGDPKKKDKKKDKDKDKEAHCGADKGKHEGACGGDKKEGDGKGDKEGSCGEGSCG